MPFGLGLGELLVVLLPIAIIGAGAAALVRVGLRNPTGSPSHRVIEERYRALATELHATQSQLDEVRGKVVQLEEKLAFTQSLLESRNPAGPALPPSA
jgi:hypothetical protein